MWPTIRLLLVALVFVCALVAVILLCNGCVAVRTPENAWLIRCGPAIFAAEDVKYQAGPTSRPTRISVGKVSDETKLAELIQALEALRKP